MLRQLFQHGRSRIAIALLASGMAGLASALLLATINRVISGDVESPWNLALSFIVASLLMFVLRWFALAQFVHIGQGVQSQLRRRLAARFAHEEYTSLERGGPGRVMAMLTDDVEAVARLFTALPELALQSAMLVGCLGYLASLSPLVFAVTLVFIAGGVTFYHFSNLAGIRHLRDARTTEDGLFQHFHALFDGSKELRLNARLRRAFLDQSVGERVEQLREQRTKGFLMYARANSFGSFLLFAVIGGVLFLLPLLTPVVNTVKSAYAITFLYLLLPIEGLLTALPALAAAQVALERIETVASESCADQAGSEPPAMTAFRSLELRAVEHAYRREGDDREFLLGPLNLTLSPSELVFVTGGNGSGKTTLAKILVGLYGPSGGEIRLNDEPVDDAKRPEYRQIFSAVFTDFHLFDVGLATAQGDIDTRANEWLTQLRLDHKLRIADGVFSTTALSRGQRKRLALLTASLEDRPVLVFDEWAADQDPVFKDFFYRQLLPDLKARGKAVLVITHDDRYFGLADRHLVLSEGHLIDATPPAAVAHSSNEHVTARAAG